MAHSNPDAVDKIFNDEEALIILIKNDITRDPIKNFSKNA